MIAIDMKKPECCEDCLFLTNYDVCLITGKCVCYDHSVDSDCPLMNVETVKAEYLIDKSVLERYCFEQKDVEEYIDFADDTLLRKILRFIKERDAIRYSTKDISSSFGEYINAKLR